MSDNAAIHRDAFWLMVDTKLGSGMSRETWASQLLPGRVIKVEEGAGRFQNVIEWETWQRVKGTPFERWFAPCESISANGSVLVMARTTPAPKYPDLMPVFLTDFKRSNYGMHGGHLVCHDYGTHLLFENGMSKRMRKVEWRDS